MKARHLRPVRADEAAPPAAKTPRYAGPVIVDPAQDGNKLVPNYADPWGMADRWQAPDYERTSKRHLTLREFLLLTALFGALLIAVALS